MSSASPSKLFLDLLEPPFTRLSSTFADLPELPSASAASSQADSARAAAVLDEVATRLADNYPYFHPL
ncbi:MAG TPA: hypothetical protein VIM62_06080 [Acidobacteriaceae bacterium]